jgi:hypothetical protein
MHPTGPLQPDQKRAVVAFRSLYVNHCRVAGHVQHPIICQSTV